MSPVYSDGYGRTCCVAGRYDTLRCLCARGRNSLLYSLLNSLKFLLDTCGTWEEYYPPGTSKNIFTYNGTIKESLIYNGMIKKISTFNRMIKKFLTYTGMIKNF